MTYFLNEMRYNTHSTLNQNAVTQIQIIIKLKHQNGKKLRAYLFTKIALAHSQCFQFPSTYFPCKGELCNWLRKGAKRVAYFKIKQALTSCSFFASKQIKEKNVLPE